MNITAVHDRGNMNFCRFGIYMLAKIHNKTTSMFSRPIVSDLTAFLSLASLLCEFLHQTLFYLRRKNTFFLLLYVNLHRLNKCAICPLL